MIQNNPALVSHDILPVIQNRWSPLAFLDRPVEKEKMMTMLEAARWAPSSFNDQPWSYVIGYKGDATHKKLCDCLVEGNAWAKEAPVLMLSVARKKFAYNQKENRHCMHDVGAASAYLVLQAAELDLVTHQMEGFHVNLAKSHFNIGEDHETGSMIAIGYQGENESLSNEEWKKREKNLRMRKSMDEMIWKA